MGGHLPCPLRCLSPPQPALPNLGGAASLPHISVVIVVPCLAADWHSDGVCLLPTVPLGTHNPSKGVKTCQCTRLPRRERCCSTRVQYCFARKATWQEGCFGTTRTWAFKTPLMSASGVPVAGSCTRDGLSRLASGWYVPLLQENACVSFSQLSLCVSRACLGKMIIFSPSIKWRQKDALSLPPAHIMGVGWDVARLYPRAAQIEAEVVACTAHVSSVNASPASHTPVTLNARSV